MTFPTFSTENFNNDVSQRVRLERSTDGPSVMAENTEFPIFELKLIIKL